MMMDQPVAPLRYRVPGQYLVRVRERAIGLGTICFWFAHIPLALLIHRISLVSAAHAVATFAVGMALAAFGKRTQFRAACVGAYIVGAEVLWRMAGSQVFWELGKYATAAIFTVAMVRNKSLRRPSWPLLYFALLLPSAVLTITTVDLALARRAISFNLSGPFALAICVLFFSHLRLSVAQLQRMFLVLTGPALGIAATTLVGIATSTELVFTDESNFATSGGFGPNQVSAVLGLGALVSFLFIVLGTGNRKLKVMMFCGMLFMSVQSALTFSRGGLYSAVGAAALGSIYLIRDSRSRGKLLLAMAVLFVIAGYVLIPALDKFTEGKLSTRFQNTDSTNRDRIAVAQLRAWMDHPILGVGPGQARSYARESAHTEFTRLLAEHGSLGLLAMLLLLIAGVRALERQTTLRNKALAAAMMGWSVLFMLTAGMRLVAPAFAFGLAFAIISLDSRSLVKKRRRRAVACSLLPANSGRVNPRGDVVRASHDFIRSSSKGRHAVGIR